MEVFSIIVEFNLLNTLNGTLQSSVHHGLWESTCDLTEEQRLPPP